MATGASEAIVRSLSLPAGRPSRGSGPGATVYRGGHAFQARPETIRFVRERQRGRLGLAAVEFDDTHGGRWHYVCGAISGDGGGWEAKGGAGGSGGEPDRTEPWANFGGWGWPRYACIGGRVHGPVREVRLVDAQGTVADEDTVDGGVALLMSDEPVEQPYVIELYGDDGRLLRSQRWPPV